MSKQKPSLPKGTRDFGPAVMTKRYFILDNIKKVYQKYGYAPIETPAMENLSVLQGKYGDEGDQLLFKILNSGDFISKNKNQIINRKKEYEQALFIEEILLTFLRYLKSEVENHQPPEKGFLDKNFKDYYKKEAISHTSLNEAEEQEILRFLNTHSLSLSETIYKLDLFNLQKRDIDKEEEKKEYDHKLRLIKSVKIKHLVTDYFHIHDELKTSKILPKISEKGLRYDLTVPFARFVVMHQHELTFPFKRYQIQPVWRADRPQKGRYREFYQCDADAIGTNSLLCEAEIVLMIQEVFQNLQKSKPDTLDYAIKINNRKILSGIVEVIGAGGKETDFAVAIDKLDKIGEEKVKEELSGRGFSAESLKKISPLFSLKGDNQGQIAHLKAFLKDSELGTKGIEELEEVFSILEGLGANVPELELDVTLARGLSYYTGAIFEVKPKNVEMGSISGGGRYDGLTDNFGLPDVSGVGISFGVDRIYDVLEELKLFPEANEEGTQVLIVAFDQESWTYGLQALNKLRANNIKSELYPEPVKLKKQMKYGNDKNIPFVIVIGSEEMKSGKLTFKNMAEGSQDNLNITEILNKLASNN